MSVPDLQARPDLQVIARLIRNGTKLIDIGCEDGLLLDYLVRAKQVDGRGLELDPACARAAVGRGLSVVQGNADDDLIYFPDQAFDYAVLSIALQMMQKPHLVLDQMLRIARRAIVSIPNFGYWRNRMHLLVKGQMPVNRKFSYAWYETPNIHFCTIRDFIQLAEDRGYTIETRISLNAHGHTRRFSGAGMLTNWMSEKAVFVITQK